MAAGARRPSSLLGFPADIEPTTSHRGKSHEQLCTSVTLTPKVTLSENKATALGADSHGGVLLTALNGKIKCDNTMQSRLHLVYEELLPSIRAILFPDE